MSASSTSDASKELAHTADLESSMASPLQFLSFFFVGTLIRQLSGHPLFKLKKKLLGSICQHLA